jgi:hypothetical protein
MTDYSDRKSSAERQKRTGRIRQMVVKDRTDTGWMALIVKVIHRARNWPHKRDNIFIKGR